MDTANLAASWVSATVTTVGLGSILTQVSTIRNQLDPFRDARTEDHLAAWGSSHPASVWYKYTFAKPPPEGPVLGADVESCLGEKTLLVSRRPIGRIGEASWTVLLAVFHPRPFPVQSQAGPKTSFYLRGRSATGDTSIMVGDATPNGVKTDGAGLSWHHKLEKKPLIFYKDVACTTISRTTLVVLVILSTSDECYRYDGPAGLRLGYGGYSGTYQIEWPIGQRPTLTFKAHERYQCGRDVFPTYFPRRPSKCIEMAVGIVDRGYNANNKPLKVAFAGRKPPGRWMLHFLRNRFGAQRSAPDLYNLLGGRAYEVDFLFSERLIEDVVIPSYSRALRIRSLEVDKPSTVYIQEKEAAVIADCLDSLPWSPLAWSIHRGMKDIIDAYALPYFAAYRAALAQTLVNAVTENTFALHSRGWDPEFVSGWMSEQAASAIRGDDRCSGDVCRVVTGIAELLWQNTESMMDKTTFWRANGEIPSEVPADTKLSPDTVVALVKAYLVRWSREFDYDIYHRLPVTLFVT